MLSPRTTAEATPATIMRRDSRLPRAADAHEWKLWRTGLPFAQRFTATISDDGQTIAGQWEVADDGTNFTVDFDLTYRRVSPR